ncbi:MAG: UDP-N-acetylmuramate--L-alanine ligase [Patescibacteria group bacterium]
MFIKIKRGLRVHFIGIGGKGLNGIAKICLQKGCVVTGSDTSEKEEVSALVGLGVQIFKNHEASNIDSKIDVVVRSSLVSENCPEIEEAQRLKIPVLKRSEFLKVLMMPYRKIAIAGSHGKSTTTALFGLGLLYAKKDPTIVCGAHIKELGTYERLGRGRDIVVEACEFDRSFYDLVGDVGVITSIEKSHLEYYKDENEMVEAFETFVGLFQKKSTIFMNGDMRFADRISKKISGKVVRFGESENNDYIVKNVGLKPGVTSFSVFKKDKVLINLTINLPGTYNALNFAALVAYFDFFDLPLGSIKKLAKNFRGIKRRFDIKTRGDNFVVLDDFSHHPTQLRYVIESLKQFWPDHKLVTVFQPRQYHLLRSFLREHGEAFNLADEVILTDIAAALGDTEADKKDFSLDDIKKSINTHSPKSKVLYLGDYSKITNYIKKYKDTKAVVATIGAGDVYKIADNLALNM